MKIAVCVADTVITGECFRKFAAGEGDLGPRLNTAIDLEAANQQIETFLNVSGRRTARRENRDVATENAKFRVIVRGHITRHLHHLRGRAFQFARVRGIAHAVAFEKARLLRIRFFILICRQKTDNILFAIRENARGVLVFTDGDLAFVDGNARGAVIGDADGELGAADARNADRRRNAIRTILRQTRDAMNRLAAEDRNRHRIKFSARPAYHRLRRHDHLMAAGKRQHQLDGLTRFNDLALGNSHVSLQRNSARCRRIHHESGTLKMNDEGVLGEHGRRKKQKKSYKADHADDNIVFIKIMKPSLENVRAEIDAVDAKIVELLDKRAQLAVQTAGLKKAVYQPAREAEVLERVTRRARVFPKAALRGVYREIIGTSLSLERGFSIGILGPEATYTHLAASKHFGRNVRVKFEETIPDVFRLVEKGDVEAGVVPVENSTEGAIVHTLDNLVDSTLSIAAEILLPVRHHSLAHKKWRGKSPTKILSHPQALAQCRDYLERAWPGVPQKATRSTADAARIAARSPGVVAIASELAAEKYGLAILKSGIEDVAGNTTRFLVLSKATNSQGTKTPMKTSIAFSMKDRPGALFTMLEPFQRHRINLTKIESRPSRIKAWRYIFFLDMEGSPETDAPLAKALGELEKECRFYRVLGTYAPAQ